MISLRNINTIARYERRILFRSWFFRIFAILAILFIGLFSGSTFFNRNPFTWMFRSLPSAIVYSNFFLLNITQSVIAVFLASDFIKRDKKLDTAEVLFIRPMSNFEYITGKTMGLLWVFVTLNLLLMLLTSVFIFISGQVPFRIMPFVAYFFMVSIPSLVFIIGLTFALMTLLRNQAITFIVLLGYIALVLFYLAGKPGYVFDYMLFAMPVPFSDIIGFSNTNYIVWHRMAYLFLGSGLILFSTAFLKRIPNKASNKTVVFLSSFLFIVISAVGFANIVRQNKSVIGNREVYSRLSSENFSKKVPLMQQASINVETGEQIKAVSKMVLKNPFQQALDTLVFSINPGFDVEKVISGNEGLAFEKDRLLVYVFPREGLMPGNEMTLEMHYSGLPDFNVSYLDNEHEDVYGYDQVMTMRVDRQYGFYRDNYVLLTKENLWYPIPGVAYDPSKPAIFRQQFTNFALSVKVKPGMIPVSQGQRYTADSLVYRFDIRDPLPQLSLAVSDYEERKIDIDGIEVGIAFQKGHDYFSEHLSELDDTLTVLITEFLDDYERPIGMYYPYRKFTLVEAPVQFASRPHSWTSALAQSQPQMVFYPEWGFNVSQADFKSNYRWMKRDSDRNKEGLTEKEIQARVFTNFLNGMLAEENADMPFAPPGTSSSNPYSIYPNYYYYVNYITSDECPVLNYAFESYLMKGEDDPRQIFMSRAMGLGNNERANLMLRGKSLKQIIAEEDDQQKINNVLQVKGSYLLTWIEKQINNSNFDQFLLDYLYNNSYREIKYSELENELSQRFNIKMGSFLTNWYNESELPAFGLGNFEVREIVENSQAYFVVTTKVTNYSPVDGLVKFSFQMGGGRRRGGFFGGGMDEESEERTYLIEGKQTKELQMVLFDSPRSVIFNTLLSQNIPVSSMEWGLRSEKDENGKAEEYERVVDQPVELALPGELIVDNTDPNFSVSDPSLDNPIRKFIESRKKEEEEEFVSGEFGSPPTTWKKVANSDYFGKVEKSAMVVRSGDGSKTATWKTPIAEAGYYDIYVFLEEQRRFGRRGRRDPEGKFVYTVAHDDGVEQIELELKDFEDGWNLLGSFYFSSDTAAVVLSDEGGADRVIADAVKWVLHQ
jgi:ABC-type transport system involved in multi-copper enzyme maturation permease subunit